MFKFLMDGIMYGTQYEKEAKEHLKAYSTCKLLIDDIPVVDSGIEFKRLCRDAGKIKSSILRISVRLYGEIILQ